jgi:hypothetical protein
MRVIGRTARLLCQLARLWTTLVSQDAGIDPLQIGRLRDRGQTLGRMMLSATQRAEEPD